MIWRWGHWLWLAALATRAGAADLESLLDKDGAVWSATPSAFMAKQQTNIFHWVSAKHDVARAAGKELRFAGLPVWEALVRFETNALREITLSLYNRGDAGDMEETPFNELLATVDRALTRWSGVKGVVFREQDRTALVTINRAAWVAQPHRLDLTWTFTPRRGPAQPFRAEFVRLTITRFDPAQAPRAGFRVTEPSGPAKTLTIAEIRARVKRESTGDVVVTGIPMVDQGQKGYCVAAVMERVLRYFGRTVDQHEIAQMANTATKGGTSIPGMLSAVRQIADEVGADMVTHEKFDGADVEKLLADYNRAAQTAHRPAVVLEQQTSLTGLYGEMDTDLLRQARAKREGRLQQFRTTVAKYVNNGCPLVWGVVAGKVTEQPPVRGLGGHLRLIIGFNPLKNEILYTDSWGAGHELKRLSLVDAWTITLGLYTVEPRHLRF